MRRVDVIVLAAGLLLVGAAPVLGQQQPPPGGAQPADAKAAPGELELKFEREVYLYPGESRRDPFASFAEQDLGPRFEELTLQGIIYSTQGRSVVLLADADGRIYRARRGEAVGNARVISIEPRQAVFAVDNFGVVRQERLELKRKNSEGEKG